jgi:hypothetical protein
MVKMSTFLSSPREVCKEMVCYSLVRELLCLITGGKTLTETTYTSAALFEVRMRMCWLKMRTYSVKT